MGLSARLVHVSVSRLYNLRRSVAYRRRRTTSDLTRTVQAAIGEQWRPAPDGRPGFLCVDAVH